MTVYANYVSSSDILTTEHRDWKKELERLIVFLNGNDVQAEKLWNVVSALRGPDELEINGMDGHEVKRATTAVIREACGLTYYGIEVGPDKPHFAKVRADLLGYSHFKQHAINAFYELEIGWYPPAELFSPGQDEAHD